MRLSEGDSDPVADIQSHLEATAVPNTNVVELVATGPRPEVLAPLITAIIDAYRSQLAEAFRESSAESTAQARGGSEETERGPREQAPRRGGVPVAAQHRLPGTRRKPERSRKRAPSARRSETRTRTSPRRKASCARSPSRRRPATRWSGQRTIRRLPTWSSARRSCAKQLLDLERQFTPAYLAKDPKAIALRSRLAELERQIAVQRESSQRNALAEAREELASAQGTAARIQSQITTGQKDLGQFTARFNEYKSQQEQLNAIETAYQDASRRLAKQDATVRARTPALKVLEAGEHAAGAVAPELLARYGRDARRLAGARVAGDVARGALQPNRATTFSRRPPAAIRRVDGGGGRACAAAGKAPPRFRSRRARRRCSRGSRRCRASSAGTRWRRSSPRPTTTADSPLLLLLSGIDLDEALALRWSDVDLAGNRIHIGGGSPRDVTLHESLRPLLAARASAPSAELVLGHPDRPASRDTVNAQLLCGAHDAGIENADRRDAGLSPAHLRRVSRSTRHPVCRSDTSGRAPSRGSSRCLQRAFARRAACSRRGDQCRLPAPIVPTLRLTARPFTR